MKPAYKKALLDSHIFEGLTESEAEKIFNFNEITVKMLQKDENIFTENNFSRSVGIILKGSARVEKRGNAKPVIMNTLEPGSTFGMAAIFYEEESFPTVITATKQTAVAFISKEMLLDAFKKDSRIYENYIRLLSQKIHFLNKKTATFSSRSTSYKLYSYLLDEYSKNGENGKVTLKYNMSELASLLGVGRTSLYRELEALTDEGLIKKDGKVFTILKNN